VLECQGVFVFGYLVGKQLTRERIAAKLGVHVEEV
jgi:hypothetical protein